MAKIKTSWLQSGFKSTGIYPVDSSAISDAKLNPAKPWNKHGWRFFDESDSVVSKLKDIDSSQCSGVMDACCLDQIIRVLEPQPLPQRPTTTFTYVPSQEDRLKRGSRLAAVLTQPNNLSVEDSLKNLKLESPQYRPLSLAYKDQCVVCNENPADAFWICCSLPSCSQWLHTSCVPQIRDKTNFEISNMQWFCPVCQVCRQKDIETFKKSNT